MDFDFTAEIVKRIGKALENYNEASKAVQSNEPLSNEFKENFCASSGINFARRTDEWKEFYFGLFEMARKDENFGFEKILKALFEKTGNIEASFSSKMLAVIRADMPVWDSKLLGTLNKNFGFPNSSLGGGEKGLDKAIERYLQIIEQLKSLLDDPAVSTYLREFDCLFPENISLPPTKKLELFLTCSR